MRRPIILLFVALCVFSAFAQQPVHVESPVFVTAIDVVADVRDASGKLPSGLTAADFVLLEDGVERKVIGVDYLRFERVAASTGVPADSTAPASARPAARRPWQIVMYFDSQLSNASGRKRSAEELMKQADTLAQMGTVDVIFADPTPKALVRNSRDPEAIRQALGTVAASIGVNQLARHRRDFLHHVQQLTQMIGVKKGSPPPTTIEFSGKVQVLADFDKSNPDPIGLDGNAVRPYIDQEVQLVNRFEANLLTWLSNYRKYAPRTLIMVTDGFDVDPLEFYSANLDKGDELTLRNYVAQAGLANTANRLSRSLAGAGWTTMSLPSDNPTGGWVDDASTSGIGRGHKFVTSAQQKGPKAAVYRPLDPLIMVAEDTGGSVVSNSAKVAEAVSSLDDRLRITYQVDRKPDGKTRKIELRTRKNDLKVRSARWASSSTPDEMAETRALGLLKEASFSGDIPVEAVIDWNASTTRKSGTLRLVAKADALTKILPPGGKGDFRITLAVQVPPNQAFVTNHQVSGYNLSEGVFKLRTPLDLPAATSVIVIAIEETNTGMWGSSRIEVQ